jgi:hypothetical protein
VIVLLFLALSLASLGHKHEGWQGADERFLIEAERWQVGAPLTWVSWVRVTQTGAAPPMETLPDGSRFLPGLHLEAVPLGLSLAFAAGLAWLAAIYLAGANVGITIEQMFDEGRPLVDRAFSAKQDLVGPIGMFLVEFLVVAALLALVRIARRRTTPVAS